MKYLIRKTIFKTLFFIDLLLGTKPEVFVLCYHSISNDWHYGVSKQQFEKQINYLFDYYDFLTPSEFQEYTQGRVNLKRPAVLLTFDDGYADILKVKSFLQKKDISPILFLIANSKKVNRKEIANKKTLLNKAQINFLINGGWVIGNHGATHEDLLNISKKELEIEIKDSKKILSKNFGKIKYFAYPKGHYNREVLKFVSKSGYDLAFSMDDGFISESSEKFSVPRIGINQTHGIKEFKTLFSPSVIRFRQACKKIKLERAFA